MGRFSHDARGKRSIEIQANAKHFLPASQAVCRRVGLCCLSLFGMFVQANFAGHRFWCWLGWKKRHNLQ